MEPIGLTKKKSMNCIALKKSRRFTEVIRTDTYPMSSFHLVKLLPDVGVSIIKILLICLLRMFFLLLEKGIEVRTTPEHFLSLKFL